MISSKPKNILLSAKSCCRLSWERWLYPLHLLGPVLLGCYRLQLTSLSSMIVLQPPLLCEGWGGHPLCLSGDRYDWCASMSHPSSYMLVNHGPSQQNSKEEYKKWKWSATAKYYTSPTKTMLPTRKSVPRFSRQLDHTKTSWPSLRDANCSGMVMFPVQRCSPYSHPTLMGDNEEMFTLQSPYLDGWWWRDVHPTVTLPWWVMMKRCSPYSHPTFICDDEEMFTLQLPYLDGRWWRDAHPTVILPWWVMMKRCCALAITWQCSSSCNCQFIQAIFINWYIRNYMSWCATLHELVCEITWAAKLHKLVC